ncbi:S-layer homology domain-containing protein [Intestinibacillus massiliensis]|nr:S-layer homology domain-containing protein [Intestinibacillus massiliensis]
MKKEICAAALAACLLASPALAASAPSDWAKNDLERAVSSGLVPSGLVGEWQRPITRAEFCALAQQLAKSQKNGFALPKENPFTDTDDENVLRLSAAGIVSGKSEGIFAPNDPLTRQEAATMLYRMTNTSVFPASYADQREQYAFADLEQINHWADDGVAFCYRTGVMSGVGENRFDPEGVYTVEQAVITALRMQAYAASQQPTPLTMEAAGVPMLYANNPEILDPRKFEKYGIYTAKTTMPVGEPIDAEYYHWSYMGSYQPMILGVAVTNNGKRTAQVTIDKRGVGLGQNSMEVSRECYEQFYESGPQEEPASIKPGETKLVVKDTLPGGTMINARVQLTAQSDGLSMKLVALKQEVASEFLDALPRGIDDGAGRTAGRFNFSERNVPVDASAVQYFTLCGNTAALWKLNPGEYPQERNADPLAVKDTGTAPFTYFLNGNFATTYNLKFKNAAGKTLLIRPNDPTVADKRALYLMWTEERGWYSAEASVKKPHEIELTGDDEVRFLLLGGNYGNVGFRVMDTPE